MPKYLSLLLILAISCSPKKSIIRDHVFMDAYVYEYEGAMKAAAMPKIKKESSLLKYERRFDYLLMNTPALHTIEKRAEISKIFNLYPDTTKLKERYLEELTKDKKLVKYFEEAFAPINKPDLIIRRTYTEADLMEVASKFFFCDKIEPDTTIQAHVCIALNGMKEADWEKDYVLLEAFCFEAIFSEFENEVSKIWETFGIEKEKSEQKFKPNITTLEKYLEEVKLELFDRMEKDEILKKELLKYYEANKTNLGFRIID